MNLATVWTTSPVKMACRLSCFVTASCRDTHTKYQTRIKHEVTLGITRIVMLQLSWRYLGTGAPLQHLCLKSRILQGVPDLKIVSHLTQAWDTRPRRCSIADAETMRRIAKKRRRVERSPPLPLPPDRDMVSSRKEADNNNKTASSWFSYNRG